METNGNMNVIAKTGSQRISNRTPVTANWYTSTKFPSNQKRATSKLNANTTTLIFLLERELTV